MAKSQLPIDPVLPEIIEAVRNTPITLLEAEPGAGKTTRVPAALLEAGFAHVYVLEPRRLAARLAAHRVAEELNTTLGEQVGYQVRFESVSSARTRLWFLTEGVLTRKLLADPLLPDARVVVLDEFHERHLETDLALALLRRAQRQRSNLRLLLMSATLGAKGIAEALEGACIVRAPGRVFPVDVRYTPHTSAPLEDQVAAAVGQISSETSGHTLVFLPGAAEIRKAIAACTPIARRHNATVLPLHGELSPAEQDAAVAPSAGRKIICSTNVAESSVTIDGVTAVVDSGLARILSHSHWSGFSRLRIEKIPRSSAIQRAGRAGRTAPGTAIRLYPESDFVRRPENLSPEIGRADLTQLVLQLASAGLAVEDLLWLQAPSTEMLAHASALLRRLDAFDETGALTVAGRQMARLALHPRLARLAVDSAARGVRDEGAELAARLSEGRIRLDESSMAHFVSDIDRILASDLSFGARRLKRQILDSVKPGPRTNDPQALEKAVLAGFPDRVARKRGDHLLLSAGGSARLDRQSATHSEFLVALEVDDRAESGTPLVRIASPIEPDWLLDQFPDHVTTVEELTWNREAERVEQMNALRYDALVIDDSRGAPTDRTAAARLLVAKALESGINRFTDVEDLDRLLRRVHFAARYAPEISVPSDLLEAALAQLATGLTGFDELRTATRDNQLLFVLQSMLPMRLIDEIAPTHVQLPSGRRARIEYHEGKPPSVASRLQDFFGLRESPSVARGSVPLVVELLAPNHRPVQVTTDLVSFWKNLYPQVRKELSRRYPRHSWPEVPA